MAEEPKNTEVKSGAEEEQKLTRKERKKRGIILARRKKEFTYRGYTLEQLRALSLHDLLPLLPARARRSYKRGLNEEQQALFKKIATTPINKVIRTHRREIIILPSFVGRVFAVHNGKDWVKFEVKPEMIGHYLGEFALTRKFIKHSGPGVGATRSSKFLPLK